MSVAAAADAAAAAAVALAVLSSARMMRSWSSSVREEQDDEDESQENTMVFSPTDITNYLLMLPKLDDDGFIKKPASWSECLSMLCSQKEERHLKIQNPDGLLYLTFLYQSGMLFFVCKYFRILSTYII